LGGEGVNSITTAAATTIDAGQYIVREVCVDEVSVAKDRLAERHLDIRDGSSLRVFQISNGFLIRTIRDILPTSMKIAQATRTALANMSNRASPARTSRVSACTGTY
jgi:hypothetical protein